MGIRRAGSGGFGKPFWLLGAEVCRVPLTPGSLEMARECPRALGGFFVREEGHHTHEVLGKLKARTRRIPALQWSSN